MYEVVVSPLARVDLKSIWHYSFEEWGESKATDYLLELDIGMQSLARHPELGRSCDWLRAGYRLLEVNQHQVFYRLADHTVDVIRVLHERMDPDRHL